MVVGALEKNSCKPLDLIESKFFWNIDEMVKKTLIWL